MSTSVAAPSNNVVYYSPNEKDAPPKPTITQQMDTLSASGNSPHEIAVDLGMTTAEVDADLGIQTTVTTASSAAAATAHLSVHA